MKQNNINAAAAKVTAKQSNKKVTAKQSNKKVTANQPKVEPKKFTLKELCERKNAKDLQKLVQTYDNLSLKAFDYSFKLAEKVKEMRIEWNTSLRDLSEKEIDYKKYISAASGKCYEWCSKLYRVACAPAGMKEMFYNEHKSLGYGYSVDEFLAFVEGKKPQKERENQGKKDIIRWGELEIKMGKTGLEHKGATRKRVEGLIKQLQALLAEI